MVYILNSWIKILSNREIEITSRWWLFIHEGEEQFLACKPNCFVFWAMLLKRARSVIILKCCLSFTEGQASGGLRAPTLPSLAMYASNDDDPYVTLKDDEVIDVVIHMISVAIVRAWFYTVSPTGYKDLPGLYDFMNIPKINRSTRPKKLAGPPRNSPVGTSGPAVKSTHANAVV